MVDLTKFVHAERKELEHLDDDQPRRVSKQTKALANKRFDLSRLSPEEQIELLDLLEEDRINRARDSFETYCEICLDPSLPAKHHKLIINELEALEAGESGLNALFILLPPGSAKSTYASVLFGSWYVGRNPTHAVVAASHTASLAERFGRRIRNLVASKQYFQIFNVGVSPSSSAAGQWETTREGEYFACGIGGSVTGRRANLGLIDDPVASREDADSETMREKAWEWFINDFMTRLKPNAKVVFIMTRWHEDDLGARAMNFFGNRAKVIKIPMEAGENDPLGREPGELLWPEYYTPEMLELAKRDPRVWSALYQQDPRPHGGGEFQKSWLRFYGNTHGGRGMNKVILVDPASGKRKNNDYTSIFVIGLGSDENCYVLDMVRDRLNLSERADKVFALHRKWRPYEVRYERYGMMADIEHLESKMELANYRFKVVEVGGKLGKEDRIRRALPFFQAGRIYFPQVFWYTRSDAKPYDLVDEFIKEEYLAFPVGRHDDMMDALSRLFEPGDEFELKFPKYEPSAPAIASLPVLDSEAGY